MTMLRMATIATVTALSFVAISPVLAAGNGGSKDKQSVRTLADYNIQKE